MIYLLHDVYKDIYEEYKSIEEVEKAIDKRLRNSIEREDPEQVEYELYHVSSRQRLKVSTIIKKEWIDDTET